MKSLLLSKRAFCPLLSFVCILGFSISAGAQEFTTVAAIAEAENARVALYEYTVVPESKPGGNDDYISFETSGSFGDFVNFEGTLNGKTISKRVAVESDGYARWQGPANGRYQNVSIKINGTTALSEPALTVNTRSLLIGKHNPGKVGVEQDAPYTGKRLQDADPLEKSSSQCVNNKLANRGFEGGGANWYLNGGAKLVSADQSNEHIYEGANAVKLDWQGAITSQSFTVGAKVRTCFSAYAKNHSSTGITQIGVRFFNAGNHIIYSVYRPVTHSSGYNLYTLDETTPAGTARAEVYFYRDHDTNSDSWADQFCFQDKGVIVDGGDPPAGFTATCGEGKTVDAYVSDVNCSATPQARTAIPSSGNVYQVVAEVVYKGANPGSETFVLASNGNNYLLKEVTLQNAGNSGFHVYRGLIPASVSWVEHTATNGKCHNDATSNGGLQSLSSFAFRNVTEETAGSGSFTALTGYNSIESFAIDIPTSTLTRDVVLKIPFSEITLDGRYVRLNAIVDDVQLATDVWTFGPAGGPCCIDLLELTVPNVPGGATSIEVEVDTRNGQGPGGVDGQSYTIAGLAYADVDCPKNDGDCILSFRAKGDCGHEKVELRLNNTTVATYVMTTSFQDYTFNNFTTGSDVELHFVNDEVSPCDRNVTIEYVNIGGDSYDTSVESVSSNPHCNPVAQEKLNCNGKFDFGVLSCCRVTDRGHFLTDHITVCVEDGTTFDAPVIDITAGACSDGGQPQYQWQSKPAMTGNWENIPGATGEDYDPAPRGAGSVWYRRKIKCACESSFNTASVTRDVHIRRAPSAQVAATDASCNGQDDGSITFRFSTDAQNEFTRIELSIDGGASRQTVNLSSGAYTFDNLAAGAYTPVVQFEGGACGIELDEVVIGQDSGPEVIAYCGADPLVKNVQNENESCSPQTLPRVFFARYLFPNDLTSASESLYRATSGTLEEYDNGSARLRMQLENQEDNNFQLEVDVVFTGRTLTQPAGSPKFDLCVSELSDDWYYYQDFTGTISGKGAVAGLRMSIFPMGPALQVGTGGNLLNPNTFGLSTWISYTIISQPTTGVVAASGSPMDFNIKLNGTALPKFDGEDECAPICVGESTEIKAQGSGGTAPYSYSWSNSLGNGQTQTVTPTATTTYTVTITDANGCTETDEVTITVNRAEWDHVNLGQDVDNCEGDCNGSIIVDPNFNATGPFYVEYTFAGQVTRFPATGSLTDSEDITIPGLCAGTYTDITIVGVETGCSAVWPDDVVISEPTAPTVSVPNASVCEGERATLSANPAPGANNAYTYLWNTGSTDRTLVFDNARFNDEGTYSVTITDVNSGCTATASGNLDVRETPDVTTTVTNADCDEDNGAINFTFGPQDGRTGIEFSLNGGAFQSAAVADGAFSFTELAPGAYAVTVRWGDDSCPVDLGSFTVEGADNVTDPGTIGANQEACDQLDVAELTGTPATGGGGEPIRYAWQSREGTSGSWATISGTNTINYDPGTVMATTQYRRLARRSNACPWLFSNIVTISITDTPTADISAQPLTVCSGESVTYTATTSGNAGADYVWDFGPFSAPATAQGAGPHVVTYAIAADRLGDASPAVTLTVSRGDCSDTDTENVSVRDLPEVDDVTSTNPNCGAANGSITINFPDNPNRTGIEFSIDGGVTFPYTSADGAGSLAIDDLAAGSYDLVARWGNGDCPVDIEDATLTNELGPDVTASGGATICEGGAVTLGASVSGGAGNVSYAWNMGAGAGASVEVSPTVTTTYTVTATDANGCSDSDQVTVTVAPDPEVIIATTDESTICEGATVTFTSEVSGGLECRDVRWQQREGTSGAFSTVANADTYSLPTTLAPGTYQVRAQYICDGEGCNNDNSNVITIEVTEDPEVTISVDDNMLCIGETATITATPSGGLDCSDVRYQFREGTSGAWSNVAGAGNAITTDAGLAAGTYQYRAILDCAGDECNRAISSPVTLTVNPDPTATIADQSICAGEPATLTVAPVVGATPFTFDWSNNGGTNASATFTPTTTTTYTVTFTDANGCTGEATGRIVVKPQPVADITAVPTAVCSGEEVTFTASGAVAGAVYAWNFGENASPATATGQGPIVVTYTLPADQSGNGSATATLSTSNDGCTDEDEVVITIYDTPEVTEVTSVDPTCGQSNGSITIVFPDNPSRSSISFSIDGGLTFPYSSADDAGSRKITGLSAGVYDLFARWGNDACPVDIEDVTLTDQDGPTVTASANDAICIGESATITASVVGGNGAVTYVWMPGNLTGATQTVDPTATTTYTVTATDENGCEASDQVTITVNPLPVVTVDDFVTCAEETGLLKADVTVGTAPYTYLWSDGTTTRTLKVEDILETSTYTVTVTDANGCTGTGEGTITVNPLPLPDLSDDITICEGESTTLIVEGVFFSTATPFVYEWFRSEDPTNILSTTTELTVTPTDLGVNNYFVRVTDANGCKERDVVMVTVVPSPEVDVNDAEICVGEMTTLTAVGSGAFGRA